MDRLELTIEISRLLVILMAGGVFSDGVFLKTLLLDFARHLTAGLNS